jgi:probable O-glycosylation ligase (exosortase A-associated)
MCFSVLTSIWRSNTIDFLGNFLKVYVAYFLIINLVKTLNQYRSIVWAMIISMACIGLVSIKDYYASGGQHSGERMFGAFSGALFGDPNDMALGFIMLLPFLYYDLFRGKLILRKIILIVLMLVFLWGIVLTQSRGGFIGMGAMVFVLWLRSRRKVMFAILGIVILGLAWPLTPHSFRDRMMGIQSAAGQDNAAISRMDAWKAGASMMVHRVFGVGAGNFGEAFPMYRPPNAVDPSGMRRVAHNIFVQVGGETGIFGFIIFICMIGSALFSLNKIKNMEGNKEIALLADATFLSLIGYCASGLFLAQAYNFVLYYLIGFSVALEKLASYEK